MTDYITNIQEFQNSKRSERYKRLRVSARIAHEVTHHSVGSCMSAMTGSFVDVVYNKSTGRSSFNGLITCGSVWDCPVCSAKISYKRRDELNLALDNWHDAGGHVVMVTYTVRHNKGDKLDDLVKVLNGGVRFVKSGAPYKRKKELYKIVGSVTAAEVLYNPVNGWHYHKHQVLFIDNQLSDQEITEFENWLYDRYNGYLLKKWLFF